MLGIFVRMGGKCRQLDTLIKWGIFGGKLKERIIGPHSANEL